MPTHAVVVRRRDFRNDPFAPSPLGPVLKTRPISILRARATRAKLACAKLQVSEQTCAAVNTLAAVAGALNGRSSTRIQPRPPRSPAYLHESPDRAVHVAGSRLASGGVAPTNVCERGNLPPHRVEMPAPKAKSGERQSSARAYRRVCGCAVAAGQSRVQLRRPIQPEERERRALLELASEPTAASFRNASPEARAFAGEIKSKRRQKCPATHQSPAACCVDEEVQATPTRAPGTEAPEPPLPGIVSAAQYAAERAEQRTSKPRGRPAERATKERRVAWAAGSACAKRSEEPRRPRTNQAQRESPIPNEWRRRAKTERAVSRAGGLRRSEHVRHRARKKCPKRGGRP
ncbi:hypothetical protein PsYK624_163810 [Phanerochaete sordida]|uniref:Uncharacterized protein n=1 Tax=Phanerochaete sordida TaxID=48140 RepID=A0A9P3GS00_9APHY|nr:hypothetical protein PsYK624_163810 [Phanerochaete sordida]